MEPMAGIFARRSAHLDRYVQVGVVGNRLIAVSFPDEAPADAGDDHPVLDAIEGYLDGVVEDLSDIELALTVDTTTRAVLETVREIPYGSERDLGTVARMTPGLDADDRQAVAAALERNPAPLVVPDHRVSDGPSAAPPAVVDALRALEGLG